MRRRLLPVLIAVLVAALAVAAVALASGGSGSPAGSKHDRAGHGLRAGHPHPRGLRGAEGALGHGIMGMVLDSLAGRLGVAPADLQKAVRELSVEQRTKYFQAAGLTQAEIDALKACRPMGMGFGHDDGDGGRPATKAARRAARRGTRRARRRAVGCDRAAARSAREKLKAAPKPDLAALKADLAAGLAAKLGKTPDEVLAAVRAELEQRLGQAVAIGFITQKGSDLALACFDDPATCDLDALRAEVRFKGFGGERHGRHHPMPLP